MLQDAWYSSHVYASCTNLRNSTRGKMGGWFVMVPGSIEEPTGPPFHAIVGDFKLEVPEYVL
jgi:hypothetical protein